MRVLLTGGYGCIGTWIVKDLLGRQDEVFIYDLKEDTHRLDLILTAEQIRQVKFVPGDVTDLPNLRRAVEGNRITHIIHLAGLQVPVCRADPLLGAKVNVLGTLAVFEAVRLAKPQAAVERVVYASSAAVFGPPRMYPAGPLKDDVQLAPSTHYGVFKCANEGNARIYFQDHDISSVGLRPWTVYGVGRDFGMTSEPTRAVKALALGRKCHITYGGWQDLQLVEDVANIFVRCLEGQYRGAKSYNLRGDVVDVPALQRALCAVDPRAKDLISFGEQQIAIAYDLEDAALQRDLGPMPKTPLVEGLRRSYDLFQRLHAENRLDTKDVEA